MEIVKEYGILPLQTSKQLRIVYKYNILTALEKRIDFPCIFLLF